MKKILIMLFFLNGMCNLYAGSSGYHSEAAEAAHKIEEILIANNMCQIVKVSSKGYKHNDCSNKELFFSTPGYDGFGITTYGITDKKVLLEIATLLKSEYARHNGELSVGLRAVRITFDEYQQKGLLNRLWLKLTGDLIMYRVKFERIEK
jgi:hypothetical protein